jgi:hypothetical protein
MAGTSSVKSRYALLPGHDDVETERDNRDHPIALGSVQTEAIN